MEKDTPDTNEITNTNQTPVIDENYLKESKEKLKDLLEGLELKLPDNIEILED